MAGDVIGQINFFSHTTDGSPSWVDVSPKLGFRTNSVQASARVTIHDLRGQENIVDLDTNGFEILKYDGNIHGEFPDDSETQRSHYDEIAALLQTRLGASSVIIFNHIFRARGPLRATDECDDTHKNPVLDPHVDTTPLSARWKVEELLGEEKGGKMMQNRFQVINVWRPIGPNTIINIPLSICDYRSLDPDNDIHVTELRGTCNYRSSYRISRNARDAQKWYYLSEMRSDEMFVFKVFDSNPNVARFGAHTGFINKHVSATDLQQKSIEIRCLVFYD